MSPKVRQCDVGKDCSTFGTITDEERHLMDAQPTSTGAMFARVHLCFNQSSVLKIHYFTTIVHILYKAFFPVMTVRCNGEINDSDCCGGIRGRTTK